VVFVGLDGERARARAAGARKSHALRTGAGADDAGFQLHDALLFTVDGLLCTIGKTIPTYISSHIDNKSQFLIDPTSLRVR